MSQYIDIVTSVVRLFGRPAETARTQDNGAPIVLTPQYQSNTLSFTEAYEVVSELNNRALRIGRYLIGKATAVYAVCVVDDDLDVLYSSLISTTAQDPFDLLADTNRLLQRVGIELAIVYTKTTGWMPAIFVHDKDNGATPFIWAVNNDMECILEITQFEPSMSAVSITDRETLQNIVPSNVVSGFDIWNWEGFMSYDVSTVQL